MFLQIIDREELASAQDLPPRPHNLDDWSEWVSWEPPAKIAKLAPFYKAGYDNDGLAGKFFKTPGLVSDYALILPFSPSPIVYMFEFGKWDIRSISSLSVEESLNFQKYIEKLSRLLDKTGQTNGGNAFVVNMDGFVLRSFASRHCKIFSVISFPM